MRCAPREETVLSAQLTFAPDAEVPGRGRVVCYASPGPGTADLDAAASKWGFPPGKPTSIDVAAPVGDGLSVVTVDAVAWDVLDALEALLAVNVAAGPSWRTPPDSVRVWSLAARAARRCVRTGRLAPTLRGGNGGIATAAWSALPATDPSLREALGGLADALPPAGHAIAVDDSRVWSASALLTAFMDAVADAVARNGGAATSPGRPRERLLPWTARWIEALADPDDPRVPLGREAQDRAAAVAGWLASTAADGARTVLRLIAPDDADGPWRVPFSVRTAEGEEVSAAEVWARQAAEDDEATDLAEALLRGLGRAARLLSQLDTALRQEAPTEALLDVNGAWQMLDVVAPALEGTDVEVELPEGLAEATPRIRLRVDGTEQIEAGADPDATNSVDQLDETQAAELAAIHSLDGDFDPDPGRGTTSGLLAGFSWEVALGDRALSAEEFAELVAAQSPLVRWRDTWVHLDRSIADRVAALPEASEIGFGEALALALAGSADPGVLGADGAPDGESVEVVADGAVAELVARVRDTAAQPPVPSSPDGFEGELRPYQQRGVAWLRGMGDLGLGAVLADDMGLGKTIQLLAYLVGRGTGPHLVICPTSVVGNWGREISRFAPDLEVTRFHGPERPRDLTGIEGVVLTSYGVVRRDVPTLSSITWDTVALDEAQHVKNPATAGAKAVRQLRADHVIALTGTPLENRLAELWSLMDATNPGLLGSRASFGRRFVAPVERDGDRQAAERLRRLVAPFVLRRTKNDPDVIADLPEKLERTVVCGLTAEQAALYQAAVDRTLGSGLSEASSMERRGRILALLTELKQICNHPAQYLREAANGPPQLVGRSGKLAVAREIVGEAVDAGEQVLVFTQFVAMGNLLVQQIAADIGVDVPFLHGGVPATARDRMVAAFQGELDDTPPALVVSLRAGGTGLNLTAATHVLHFDRWWNPAVEDQATDRAHRIGQHKTVEVHKLVTAGTVEERVAELLERKRALADAVVGAGEAWITELDDADLRELVALSDATVEDDWDDDMLEVSA